MGLCNLSQKTHGRHHRRRLPEGAQGRRARRLKDIQRLIGEPSEQGNFAFAQNHPLIRDLRTYSDFISSAPSTRL